MKTHIPDKILILFFVLLLPALHSCTMQKRLYRPGFYVERNSSHENISCQHKRMTENIHVSPAQVIADTSFKEKTAQVKTGYWLIDNTPRENETVIQVNETAGAVEIKMNPKKNTDKRRTKLIPENKQYAHSKFRIDLDDPRIGVIVWTLLSVATVCLFFPATYPVLIYASLFVLIVFAVVIAVIIVIGIIDIIVWLIDFRSGGCGMYNN